MNQTSTRRITANIIEITVTAADEDLAIAAAAAAAPKTHRVDTGAESTGGTRWTVLAERV
tara:strand:+ start:326 stop:505 length:180 start_codon:yes stop_codon:yes gene_type:complete